MPYDFRDPEYCPKSLTKYFYVLTTANKIAKICTYVAFFNNAFDRDQKMLLTYIDLNIIKKTLARMV